MSRWLFKTDSHAECYRLVRPRVPQDIVDRVLQFAMSSPQEKGALAIDVGCGSGQLTNFLSPAFEVVQGFDISPAQIAQAKLTNKAENVSFHISPAECLPVASSSVDLVTVATAAHWFDFKRFAQEVERILKPGGCFVVTSYGGTVEIHHHNKEIEVKLNDCVSKLCDVFMPHWTISNAEFHWFYETFTVPFGYVERVKIPYTFPMTVASLANIYRSYSPAVKMKMLFPERDSVGEFERSILSILGLPLSDASITQLDVTLHYWLCTARKECVPVQSGADEIFG